MPDVPQLYEAVSVNFADDFPHFREEGRTFQVLDLLERKSTLNVAKSGDALFPSIDLIFGYNKKDMKWILKPVII